jgi:importin-7
VRTPVWPDTSIRFACAEKQPRTFAEGDQAAVRERLLDGVCHAPTNVRLQLEECLKVVVVHDYPNRWPSLLPSLQVALTSSDVLVVAGALRALRIVVRKYEFTDETERAPLLATTDAVLPTVLAVFQALVANPDPSLELAEMLKLCCKIFWSICYMQIPPLLTQEAQFQGRPVDACIVFFFFPTRTWEHERF